MLREAVDGHGNNNDDDDDSDGGDDDNDDSDDDVDEDDDRDDDYGENGRKSFISQIPFEISSETITLEEHRVAAIRALEEDVHSGSSWTLLL